MRLASVSLPVPVSPTISTLLSLPAITSTKSKTVRIRGLRATTTESTENGGVPSTTPHAGQRGCQHALRAYLRNSPQHLPKIRRPDRAAGRSVAAAGENLRKSGSAGPARALCCVRADVYRTCRPRPRGADPALRPSRPALHLVPDRRRVQRAVRRRRLRGAPGRRLGTRRRAAVALPSHSVLRNALRLLRLRGGGEKRARPRRDFPGIPRPRDHPAGPVSRRPPPRRPGSLGRRQADLSQYHPDRAAR